MTFGMKVLSAVAAAAFGCLAATSAGAATISVSWFGVSDFNSAEAGFFPGPIVASKFVGISGQGTFEACCSSGITSFEMDLKVDGQWTNVLQWTANGGGRNRPQSLHDLNLLLLLQPVDFGTNKTISGIRLMSDPPGHPAVISDDPSCQRAPVGACVTPADPNFKNIGFSGVNSSPEVFTFESIDAPPPAATPLPAALPLMATILGGGGLAAWRRRRKQVG